MAFFRLCIQICIQFLAPIIYIFDFYISNTKIKSKAMAKENEQFNLDHQWNLYLERVGLKGKKLAVNQYREMKQTFIGACGQMMILMRDEVGALEDDEAIEVMQNMLNQVGEYFLQAAGRNN